MQTRGLSCASQLQSREGRRVVVRIQFRTNRVLIATATATAAAPKCLGSRDSTTVRVSIRSQVSLNDFPNKHQTGRHISTVHVKGRHPKMMSQRCRQPFSFPEEGG